MPVQDGKDQAGPETEVFFAAEGHLTEGRW